MPKQKSVKIDVTWCEMLCRDNLVLFCCHRCMASSEAVDHHLKRTSPEPTTEQLAAGFAEFKDAHRMCDGKRTA